jgi:hypothetical protein
MLILLQQRVDVHYRALDIKGYTAIIEEIEYNISSEPITPINIIELYQVKQEILDKLSGVLELSL